jgi:hypothetical protein
MQLILSDRAGHAMSHNDFGQPGLLTDSTHNIWNKVYYLCFVQVNTDKLLNALIVQNANLSLSFFSVYKHHGWAYTWVILQSNEYSNNFDE